MTKDYYWVLWVNKSATNDEIKKAYRKKAMEFHPDRNKWDKSAEAKFKDVNEAYETLGDSSKRKQYDTFGSSSWNFYNNSGGWSWFSGFEDIFGWSRSSWKRPWSSWVHFDFSEMFGWGGYPFWEEPQVRNNEGVSLDIEKTVEVPFFDFLFWTSVQVNNWIWKTVTIKIKEGTKPWVKMRVKWYWRSLWSKTWNLLVKVDAKMPKHISEVDTKILKSIKENIWY